MRINFNKEDIEIMYEILHQEILYVNDRIQNLNCIKIKNEEKENRICEYKKKRKKLYKINNALMDKIIEMEYYEEQSNNDKNNGNNNSFFKHVEEFLS